MKCTLCGKEAKVINSRWSNLRKIRRRECSQGHRFTTYEVEEGEYKLMLKAMRFIGDVSQVIAQ